MNYPKLKTFQIDENGYVKRLPINIQIPSFNSIRSNPTSSLTNSAEIARLFSAIETNPANKYNYEIRLLQLLNKNSSNFVEKLKEILRNNLVKLQKSGKLKLEKSGKLKKINSVPDYEKKLINLSNIERVTIKPRKHKKPPSMLHKFGNKVIEIGAKAINPNFQTPFEDRLELDRQPKKIDFEPEQNLEKGEYVDFYGFKIPKRYYDEITINPDDYDDDDENKKPDNEELSSFGTYAAASADTERVPITSDDDEEEDMDEKPNYPVTLPESMKPLFDNMMSDLTKEDEKLLSEYLREQEKPYKIDKNELKNLYIVGNFTDPTIIKQVNTNPKIRQDFLDFLEKIAAPKFMRQPNHITGLKKFEKYNDLIEDLTEFKNLEKFRK